MTAHPIHTEQGAAAWSGTVPMRVTIEPVEPPPGFWYPALEVLQRDIAPVLTAAPLKIIHEALMYRHRSTGLAILPGNPSPSWRRHLCERFGFSSGTISEALALLATLHHVECQRPVLAVHSATCLEPLPGWPFAGKSLAPASSHSLQRADSRASERVLAPASTVIDRNTRVQTPIETQETNPPRPDRTVRLRPSTPAVQIGDDDDRVRMLCAGMAPRHRGFTPEAARSILASTEIGRASCRERVSSPV